MANRLKKLADARYSAGSPYKPAVPGYCRLAPRTNGGFNSSGSSGGSVISSIGLQEQLNAAGYIGVEYSNFTFGYNPPYTSYTQVCTPGTPAVAAVAPSVTYTSVVGWNAGAHSTVQLQHDGYFEFQICDSPVGVVVGLAADDVSTLPSEPTHAVYARGTTLDILESGVLVHTAPVPHDYDNVYRIQRVGLTVTYSGPGWSYTSGTPSAGPRFLDAALYSTGDFVDNPDLVSLDPTGSASGSFSPMVGAAYEGDYAEAYGSFGRMTGEAIQLPTAVAAGSLNALTGVASEGVYVYGGGSMQPLVGDANGGYQQVELIFGVGSFAPMSGVAEGLTGEVGTVSASLPPMGGWASEGPYAEAAGSLGAMRGYADSGWVVPGETYVTDPVLVGGFFFPQDVASGTIAASFEVGTFFDGNRVVEDGIFDALVLSDTVTATQAIEAFIAATLLLGNDISNLVASDETRAAGRLVGTEQAQYAVNVLTSALTNYSGFNFTAFANVNQTLYGAKRDGVYRVRPGDDNGDTLDAYVDFGSSTFGASTSKHLEAVYLGANTDGQVFVRLETGTDSRLYRAVPRGDVLRAKPAGGVGGRLWNVSLEIVDATEFEIDLVEILVGVSTRRITSR